MATIPHVVLPQRTDDDAVRIDRRSVMLYIRSNAAGITVVELRVNSAPFCGMREFSPDEWSDLLAAVKAVGRAFNLGGETP